MGTLAENLKRIRQERGLSQDGLAKASSVSQQLISQIENGKNTTTKELPELAKALSVSISDLDENFTTAATTAEEEDVLTRYRKVPARQKELVRDLLRELAPEDESPE